MRRERCPSRATFKSARFHWRPPKPTITKLMSRGWLPALFGMRGQRFFKVSLVQFLAIHIRMRSHSASLHWPINSQREMPSVVRVFAVKIHCHWCHLSLECDQQIDLCRYTRFALRSQDVSIPTSDTKHRQTARFTCSSKHVRSWINSVDTEFCVSVYRPSCLCKRNPTPLESG